MKLAFLSVLLFTGFAIAQVAGAPVVPVDAGAGAVQVLTTVSDKIPTAIPGVILTVLVFLIDAVMRFYPTAKPRSLFLVASGLFKIVGTIFEKISTLLDSVVQNIKPDDQNKAA